MTTYYLRSVEPAVIKEGDPVSKRISLTIRSLDGAEYVLRLIPGYDPYMTAIVVNGGEYGFYRFDRRMRSMSDEAEVRGLGVRVLHQILRDCERNLKTSELDIYFVDHITGELDMPLLQRDNFKYSIKSRNLTVMSLAREAPDNHFFSFTTTMRAIFVRMKIKVESIENVTAAYLLSKSKLNYGKKCIPSFERLFSN